MSPEQISSLILKEMKLIAERHLNCKVEDAVVTVPAYFNDGQRQATKKAGKLADLNIRNIINEPTAAALAYTYKGNIKRDETIFLVFDLGGGTFDVSIVKVINFNFCEVLGKHGDVHLGGGDFDKRILDIICKLFLRQHNIDISTNTEVMNVLLNKAEEAKKQLSGALVASIAIRNIVNNINFQTTITRQDFETACQDLFENTIICVDNAIATANINKKQIQEILLVGGATRMPQIKQILMKHFDGLEPISNLNPDEIVAYGAAIQRAIVSNIMDPKIRAFTLVDTTPLSLGISVKGGLMSRIIQKNTKIPCQRDKMFFTTHENQTEAKIKVYEGEQTKNSKNNFLGCFTLQNLPSAPIGYVRINVTFKIDFNGILSVTATNTLDGSTNSVSVEYTRRGHQQQQEQRQRRRQLEMEASNNDGENEDTDGDDDDDDDNNNEEIVIVDDSSDSDSEPQPKVTRLEDDEEDHSAKNKNKKENNDDSSGNKPLPAESSSSS